MARWAYWICSVAWLRASLHAYRIEKVQEVVSILFHAQFASGPGRKRDTLLEIFNLEPVFYIDSEQKYGFSLDVGIVRAHGLWN